MDHASPSRSFHVDVILCKEACLDALSEAQVRNGWKQVLQVLVMVGYYVVECIVVLCYWIGLWGCSWQEFAIFWKLRDLIDFLQARGLHGMTTSCSRMKEQKLRGRCHGDAENSAKKQRCRGAMGLVMRSYHMARG
eukprot:Gb_35866 [translate_table: standard]